MARPRAPKGRVSLYARNGYLSISCTYSGHRHRRALRRPDDPINRAKARELAAQIEIDLALGQFDPTFEKYLGGGPNSTALIPLYDAWVAELRDRNISAHTLRQLHLPLRGHLERWGRPLDTVEQASRFLGQLRSRMAALTLNRYLKALKDFGQWAIEQGYRETSPFAKIRPWPGAVSRAKGKVFDAEEIAAILQEFRTGGYAYYHDFALFLFESGCRIGEAIALRWEHVHLGEPPIVTIAETLSRSPTGGRVRKAPKTGERGVRQLIITPQLAQCLLERRPAYAHPSRLVFPGPQGKPLQQAGWRRIWVKVLDSAGIDYRKPGLTRHTAATRALARGMTITEVASMLGHSSPQMLFGTYGRLSGPVQTPSATDGARGAKLVALNPSQAGNTAAPAPNVQNSQQDKAQ
jgi:integrase